LLTDAGLRFGPRQSVYRFGPESLQKTAARGGGLFTAGGMREIFRGLSKDFTDIAGDVDTEAAGRRLLRMPDRAIQWPIKTLGRVMNTITDPLFDHMIPALKAGSAYSRLESWLDANKMASPEAKLAKAREVAKDVDNRLGELNQDTLFWRKSVKQSANLTLISTGWVYGTYRGTFGALGVDIEHGKFAWNPTSTAATIGTVVGFMYANSIMQYLKTGTTPLQTDTPLADMLNYRTGAANKWGSPERGMIGSEIKEAYDLFKAVTWAIGTGSYSQLGPAFNSYIAAKVNPFWQMLNTLRTGEDGIGHKVAFTPDGWFGKNGYMRQLFSPIVVDQLLHGRVGSEVGLFEKLMGIREAAHQVEDFDSYMKGVGGLAARWTKEELSRARKEALANGEEPPEGSVSTRGGGASAPRVSNRAGGYAPQQPSPRQNPSFYGYAPQPQQPVAGQPSVERSAAGPMILRGAGRRPTTRRRAR
jgi:hypothetical protein